MEKEITIIIDNDTIDRYNYIYFKDHPRAKKFPIPSPQHPSINTYTRMSYQAANNLKQKWKDFIIWVIEDYGYDGMQIDCCEIEYRTFFYQDRDHDLDNISPKYIFDGFVAAGLIVDDNFRHVKKIIIECDIDKEHPRMEFIIKICDKETV